MIFNIDKLFRKNRLSRFYYSENLIASTPYIEDSDLNLGVNYSVNDDGTITLNGTAIRNFSITFFSSISDTPDRIPAGTNLKILFNGGDTEKVSLTIGSNTYHVGDTFTVNSRNLTWLFKYDVSIGDTFDNITLYPMVCLATYTGKWVSAVCDNATLTYESNKDKIDLSTLKNKIGTDSLNTTAQTLTGAVNEVNTKLSGIETGANKLKSKSFNCTSSGTIQTDIAISRVVSCVVSNWGSGWCMFSGVSSNCAKVDVYQSAGSFTKQTNTAVVVTVYYL